LIFIDSKLICALRLKLLEARRINVLLLSNVADIKVLQSLSPIHFLRLEFHLPLFDFLIKREPFNILHLGGHFDIIDLE